MDPVYNFEACEYLPGTLVTRTMSAMTVYEMVPKYGATPLCFIPPPEDLFSVGVVIAYDRELNAAYIVHRDFIGWCSLYYIRTLGDQDIL